MPKSYSERPAGPGTLTVTVGSRSVTLDPLDEQKKFDACREKMDIMLAEVKRAK